MTDRFFELVLTGVTVLGLTACAAEKESSVAQSVAPDFLVGELVRTAYDGQSDDLLTGGLGFEGLQSPTPPGFHNPDAPTVEELRRYAIYTNYRALIDTSTAGGFGRIYGPNVGNSDPSGKVAGTEYLSFMKLSPAHQNVTLMVQIPASFNSEKPCLITGPSSGSRGIYGAIGTTGEWALKKGCAIAYTDKGTGTGFHHLTAGKVYDLQGRLIDAVTAGDRSSFTVPLTPELKAYNDEFPHRVAVQHAHSGLNDEKNWGQYVLSSIKFAFYVLNKERGDGAVLFTPENTLVISSSISQGGNSSLMAAEQDTEGLIDAVAVAEPNLPMPQGSDFAIQMGDQPPFRGHSKHLYDYSTFLNLYQPCAVLTETALNAPFGAGANPAAKQLLEGHCGLLKARGLLDADSTEGQIAESAAKIREMGVLDETLDLGPINVAIKLWASISADYGNAYGRFSALDNLCGLSYAKMSPTGQAVAETEAEMAALFAQSGGIAPVASLTFAPTELKLPIDYGLCYRNLVTGNSPDAQRVQKGMAETHHTANLQGKPTIIVHGQADALIHVNHSSRAYLGLNHLVEGAESQLRYYEIANAHHFDAFNAFPGFNNRYVPLHHYFSATLDLMYNHMTKGTPLPDSQVIWTKRRATDTAGKVEDLTEEHLTGILQTVDKSRIKIEQGIVKIPVQ
ncbi:3-hydroxybutyrate oligomer hydrolase family protein [Paremcibacter congregatus]|uniref:3-hydroxybutyrate oligomer hydrolase family protein n=1 Tax=Paremcibacter congregatus TaxID=2043170 RepID=UPI003A8D0595